MKWKKLYNASFFFLLDNSIFKPVNQNMHGIDFDSESQTIFWRTFLQQLWNDLQLGENLSQTFKTSDFRLLV